MSTVLSTLPKDIWINFIIPYAASKPMPHSEEQFYSSPILYHSRQDINTADILVEKLCVVQIFSRVNTTFRKALAEERRILTVKIIKIFETPFNKKSSLPLKDCAGMYHWIRSGENLKTLKFYYFQRPQSLKLTYFNPNSPENVLTTAAHSISTRTPASFPLFIKFILKMDEQHKLALLDNPCVKGQSPLDRFKKHYISAKSYYNHCPRYLSLLNQTRDLLVKASDQDIPEAGSKSFPERFRAFWLSFSNFFSAILSFIFNIVFGKIGKP